MDLAAGYQELRHGLGAVRLDRDFVRVGGPDALAFLQGQLSQDLQTLTVGGSCWSLLLQPQGKVDALLRVLCASDQDFILDTDAGWGELVIKRLERFKLRTKADIQSLDWSCLALRGPAVQAPPEAMAVKTYGEGIDLVGPRDAVAVPARATEVGADAYEALRIEEGIPRLGAELTERTIPAEVSGMLERAVSFSKGCFTGQELVARIDARGGHVPRQLCGLVIEGPAPAPGDAVLVDDHEAGNVTSATAHPAGHAVALAYMRREVVPPREARVGGRVTRISTLPFLS